jgi:hypothetical protein
VFIFKFARTSIGAHNEHLLHNRRRGRGTRDCRPPRTACLNKRAMMAVPLFDRLVLNRAPFDGKARAIGQWHDALHRIA